MTSVVFVLRNLKKRAINEERGLETGLYITSPRSQRHLTKPHCRYGKEKTGTPKELIEKLALSMKNLQKLVLRIEA